MTFTITVPDEQVAKAEARLAQMTNMVPVEGQPNMFQQVRQFASFESYLQHQAATAVVQLVGQEALQALPQSPEEVAEQQQMQELQKRIYQRRLASVAVVEKGA